MSHDEIGGTVTRKERQIDYFPTRKERRKAFGGKRQAAPRHVFSAAAHVRQDWGPVDLIELLEHRAQGYNGILRAALCTAAAIIRHQTGLIKNYRDQAVAEAVEAETATPIIPSNISPNFKRNQQPGRLSGSERKALKDFVGTVRAACNYPEHVGLPEEVMTEGRAMLAKVRKRALGSEIEAVVDTAVNDLDEVINTMRARGDQAEMPVGEGAVVDASALMPVGVEENFDEEAHFAAFGSDGDGA